MKVRVQFKPRDLWVGVYWQRDIVDLPAPNGEGWRGYITTVWVCLVPMLPVVFESRVLILPMELP